VVASLRERPMNANQLAQKLGMDYKTIRHHLGVLTKNHLVIEAGEGYGAMYFISPELEQNYDEFQGIWEKIRRSEKASNST
jgi:DNA-binding transcriptional ArsR family regulator